MFCKGWQTPAADWLQPPMFTDGIDGVELVAPQPQSVKDNPVIKTFD